MTTTTAGFSQHYDDCSTLVRTRLSALAPRARNRDAFGSEAMKNGSTMNRREARALIPLELASVATPYQVREYAKARGWIRVQTRRDEATVFRRQEPGRFEQLSVPADPAAIDDYADRIVEVVATLCEAEQRTPDKVLADLLAIADVYERLRPQDRPQDRPQEALYIGTVETLNGVMGDGGQRAGEVILLLQHEGELLKVRADLPADWYDVAYAAHREQGKYIKLRGVLKRGQRAPHPLEHITECRPVG